MRLRKGKIWGRGTTMEESKKETLNKFLREIKEALEKNIGEKQIEDIYIFSSDFARNGLPKILSPAAVAMIVRTFEGNYIKSHPFDLIMKIKNN